MRELSLDDIEMVDKGHHAYASRKANASSNVRANSKALAPQTQSRRAPAAAAPTPRRAAARPARSKFKLGRFAAA